MEAKVVGSGSGNKRRHDSTQLTNYRDGKYEGLVDQDTALLHITTLYLGNLSFRTTEEQIWELFMLDRYYYREHAENAIRYINGTNLDERIIRTDWDAGFKEGRQYGRGRGGGQVRDEVRTDNDMGLGGWGRIIALKQSNGRNQFKPQQQPYPNVIPLGSGAAGDQNGGNEETGPKM